MPSTPIGERPGPLLVGQADEETEFDQFGGLGIFDGQPLQGFVQGQDFLGPSGSNSPAALGSPR
jgi:hypothetical protein